jgi:hypothetical protein
VVVSTIQDDHRVVRFCKRKHVVRKDGVMVGVHPDFFNRRPPKPPATTPEKYLSALYFEMAGADDTARWIACRAAVPLANTTKHDALVLLHVGRIKAQGAKRKVKLRVTWEHKPAVPLKAAIHGVPYPPDEELCGLLKDLAVIEMQSMIVPAVAP